MRSVADYQALITHQHQKPKLLAMVAALVQPFVDMAALAMQLPTYFDVDQAVGDQLDAVGLWVGVTRNLLVPITGVFFAWDTDNVGWDQGQWEGPYQQGDTIYALGDDDFRLLIRARIAANQWDGTVPGAYKVWAIAFATAGFQILMQDNQDMSLDIIVIGPVSNVQQALITSGELDLKPAGVRIRGYTFIEEGPLFAWDSESSLLGGWDQAYWTTPTEAGS